MPLHRTLRATALAMLFAFALTFGMPRPAQALLDKTRFAAHLGIAYYVFHRFVLQPHHDHKFDAGAPHRTATIAKAGIAMLFAYHEVKVASKIAHMSKDPLLQKVAGGVDNLGTSFSTIGTRFKGGQFSPKDVDTLNKSTSDIGTTAAAGGLPITDRTVPIPGT